MKNYSLLKIYDFTHGVAAFGQQFNTIDLQSSQNLKPLAVANEPAPN